jgi:predicted flap endonuclease-1-like 5' DNA nuclease
LFGDNNRELREWVGEARRMSGLGRPPQKGGSATSSQRTAGEPATASTIAGLAAAGISSVEKRGEDPAIRSVADAASRQEVRPVPRAAPPSNQSKQAPPSPVDVASEGQTDEAAPQAVPSPPAEPAPSSAAGGVERLRSVRSAALVGRDASDMRGKDDLKRIRGIGVLLEKRLNILGYTRYAEIAEWTEADIERINEQLDFAGRIERENWIEQARILAAGGHSDFSRRQDRGGA